MEPPVPTVPPHSDQRQQVGMAVKALASGGVIAVPTDTLFALAANALDEVAVERVFRIKGRDERTALPLLVADPSDLSRFAIDVPPIAYTLVDRFMPGPLTIVLRKAAVVPGAVSGGLDTVALRIPDHVVPRAIVRELGAPITGTSANRSGRTGLATAAEVRDEIGGDVDLVLDGAAGALGVPSTIVDLTVNPPRILREGAVRRSDVEAALGAAVEPSGSGSPR